MPTEEIPIGVTVTMVQNTVYALPSVSVEVVSLTAAIETSLESTTGFVATTSPILNGAFARCTTGASTIRLRKNGVG